MGMAGARIGAIASIRITIIIRPRMAVACIDGSADVMLGGEDGHVVPIAACDLRDAVPLKTSMQR